jgi:nitrate reductase gamma subunit
VNTPFIFRVLPYVALATLAAGVVLRYAVLVWQRRGAADSVATRPAGGGSRFERGAWMLVALTHGLAIVAPLAIIGWNAVPLRLYVLEGVSFAFGLAALVAWVLAARRHFLRRTSLASDVFDSAFLALVFVGVASGLVLAVVHRWASTWGAAILTPYLISLSRGATHADYVEQMPFLVQLHVFTAFAGVAVAPFTSFVPLALLGVERAAAWPFLLVSRPVIAWVRRLPQKTAALEAETAAADVETQVD